MTLNKKLAVLLLPLMFAACGGEEQAGQTEGSTSISIDENSDTGGSTGAVPASPSGEPWNAEQQDAYIQCLQQNRVVATAWDEIERKCVDQINNASQSLPQ